MFRSCAYSKSLKGFVNCTKVYLWIRKWYISAWLQNGFIQYVKKCFILLVDLNSRIWSNGMTHKKNLFPRWWALLEKKWAGQVKPVKTLCQRLYPSSKWLLFLRGWACIPLLPGIHYWSSCSVTRCNVQQNLLNSCEVSYISSHLTFTFSFRNWLHVKRNIFTNRKTFLWFFYESGTFMSYTPGHARLILIMTCN